MKKLNLDFKSFLEKFKKKEEPKEKKKLNLKLKTEAFKNFSFTDLKYKFSIFRKYDYDIRNVIGVKGEQRYILYTDRKLIRIYHGKLKSSALLSTYVPLEHATFYNFTVEKSVLEKVDLDSFVETQIYENAGVNETEDYIIKYKVIDRLKNPKQVVIETIIVPAIMLKNSFKDILEETGYIDYISFPAFAYKALYEEQILHPANDIFAVILFDKIFLTFYSDGDLVYMTTLSGGLGQIFKALEKLKIKNFNLDTFKKLITQKGLDRNKFTKQEQIVLGIIQKEFNNILGLINEQMNRVTNEYDIDEFDRLYIISEYGKIPGLHDYVSKYINLDTFGFEFYEKYNLDRLPVDPFLFLGMLEAHYAYKKNDQRFNFSLFLRKPTFFYRPSGIIVLTTTASIILFSIYPAILFYQGKVLESKNNVLTKKKLALMGEKAKLVSKEKNLESIKNNLENTIDKYTKKVALIKQFIEDVYKTKFDYIPKSQDLVDITLLMNKHRVFLSKLDFEDGVFYVDVYALKEKAIPHLIDDLISNGFSVSFTQVVSDNGKYKSQLRIKE
ncbi:MAG: hypothetical protein ABGX23_01930 [Nautiliaceae bacterium]